jgi:hypothetical protein
LEQMQSHRQYPDQPQVRPPQQPPGVPVP